MSLIIDGSSGITFPDSSKISNTNILVIDNVTLGSASGNTVTINAGTVTLNNNTVISAAATKTLTINGGAGSNGLVLDANNNLTVGGTSTLGTVKSASITAANSNTVEATSGPTNTQLAGNRNKIINGGMAIDQRNAGAAVTGDAAFPVDRFQSYPSGTGSGQRIAMNNPPEISGFSHYLKFIRTGSGSNYSYISQKIENVKYLSGKQMTLSFYIRGDVINASGFTAWNGSYKDDGTFIGYGPNNGTSFTITSTWTRVSMRMDVPVISVDPGTGGGYFIIMLRCSSATESFNISTTGWQWEEGTVATPFENRLYGTELALCQRYYATSYPIGVSIQGLTNVTDGANFISINISDTGNGGPLPVSMRATPTFATYSSNGSVGANSAREGAGGSNITAITLYGGTTNNLPRLNKTSGLLAAGNVYTAHWTANAEL